MIMDGNKRSVFCFLGFPWFQIDFTDFMEKIPMKKGRKDGPKYMGIKGNEK